VHLNRRSVAAAVAFAVSLSLGQASAQTDQARAGARALAQQGAEAFKAGKYPDAVDFFTRAESMLHAPPHILYKARSLVKLGRLVDAHEEYLKIVRETLPVTAPPAFKLAQSDAKKELEEVEPRLASLRILLKGGDPAAVAIAIDGATVPAALVGVYGPADPGKHHVTATPPGADPIDVQVDLQEGEKKEVTLTVKAKAAPVVVAPPPVPVVETPPTPPPPPEPPKDEGGGGSKAPGIVMLGVGVAGLAVGTVFLIEALGKNSDSNNAFNACGGASCPPQDQSNINSLSSQATTNGVIAGIAGGVGVVGVVTGIVLLRSASKKPAPSSAWVQPWVAPTGAGVRGAF
jgi:hypothetical protein